MGAAQRRFCDGTAQSWVERVEALPESPTQQIGAAIHSVRAVDPDSMRVAADWAETRGAVLHTHVSEQRLENEQCQAHYRMTPTELLGEAGALSRRFSAVHATHVTGSDIELMVSAGSTVCLCPTTERDLGDGIGPVSQFAANGVPLTVGSDSHAVIDLFEEVRAAELDERLSLEQRGLSPSLGLLAMAASHGHRSLGWDDAGAIAVGQRADLVTIALDSIRTAGSSDEGAVEAVVFAATTADVVNVVVDGVLIVSDGAHQRIDVAGELHATIRDLMDR